jgi:hypothetical protein
MNFTEIRFFPQDFKVFSNLMRKYTFGTPRSDQQLIELHKDLQNKPYIVVSFANDLEGDIKGTTTQAALIPITSNSRNLTTLTAEINNLLDERKKEISDSYDEKTKTVKISDKINAKTETLLNRNDILQALIL